MVEINKTPELIQHHVKYLELHGEDKIVMITRSEHSKLHLRLRNEGKCQIPVDELQKISQTANRRTDKHKEKQRKYMENYNKEYIKSDHDKEVQKKYKKNYQKIDFVDSYGKNTLVRERIIYNHATGTITYSTGIEGTNGFKLPVINIDHQIVGFGIDPEL